MSKTERQLSKERSRQRILDAASALFRKKGLQATGIDEIMAKAGLTAGAFYAHFKSKDDLIEHVVWATLPASTTPPVNEFLTHYLTTKHRDHPERGCPLATLGMDLARANKNLKTRLSNRLNQAVRERLYAKTPEAKKKALKTLSLAVGALVLARMTAGTDLSDEFLQCYR